LKEIERLEAKLTNETRKTRITSMLFSKLAPLVGNPESPKEIVEKIGQELMNLCQQQETIDELATLCERLKNDKQRLNEQKNHLRKQLSVQSQIVLIGKSIERARCTTVRELQSIGQEFGFGNSDEVSLRSVVIVTVLVRLFMKIDKGSVSDNENWCWLSGNRIATLRKQLAEAAKLLASKQKENATMAKQTEELRQQFKQDQAKIEEYQKSTAFLRDESEKLNEELSAVVDFETPEC
jgi:chromosome segregation ATPase